jgi:hypothetical protein
LLNNAESNVEICFIIAGFSFLFGLHLSTMFKNYRLTSYVGERSGCEFSVLISHPSGGVEPTVHMGESIMHLFFPFHSFFFFFFFCKKGERRGEVGGLMSFFF